MPDSTAVVLRDDTVIPQLEAAVRYLAVATDLSEVKKLGDLAASAEVYARRQKLGEEAIAYAHRVKVSALARLGELLAEAKAEGRMATGTRGQKLVRVSGGAIAEPPETDAPTLSELGISRKVSAVAQQLAALPEDMREAIAARETTISHAVREARREADTAKVEAVRAPTGRHSVIVLDPPWDYSDVGDCDVAGRAAPAYARMGIEAIARLPIAALAEDNAHVYLWTTNRLLPLSFALLDGWGFRYITTLTWCKPHFGLGSYFRNSTEHVLFGVRGRLPLLAADQPTHFIAPRGRHSEKPDAFYEIVERCSPGAKLEMFARSVRPGWASWGSEGVA